MSREPVDDLWPRYLGGCAMLVAFTGMFWSLLLGRAPLLWYHPLERVFALESRPHAVAAMDFYGRVLWSLLAGLAGYPAGVWLARLLRPTRGRVWLAAAYGLALTGLAIALVGYQIWPRPPSPLPIPAWYKP